MKCLQRVVVFVLLGTVANIGVAWACASWSVGAALYDIDFDYALPRNPLPADQAWLAHEGVGLQPGFYTPFVTRTYAGWPFYSLYGEGWLIQPVRNAVKYRYRYAIEVDVEVDLGGTVNLPRPLPLRPVFPGFLANTLAYALVIHGLRFSSASVLRQLRIRRGKCPSCRYPIGKSPVCTECGAEAPR